jgi:hypothetical protein
LESIVVPSRLIEKVSHTQKNGGKYFVSFHHKMNKTKTKQIKINNTEPWNTWINNAVWNRFEELYMEETPESYHRAVQQTVTELKHWKKDQWEGWEYRYNKTLKPLNKVKLQPVLGASKSLSNCLSQCRKWTVDIWNNREDIHSEEALFAIANELKCNGHATNEDIHEFCKVMLGNKYDPKETSKRWKYIKGIPFQMNTLRHALPIHLKKYVE